MASDQEEEDSVYDFLYVDERRIAVFLSQFEQYGHLTSLTRSVSETDSTSGTLGIAVAKVAGGTSAQTNMTRQFDPRWLAPLTFLDESAKRGMIVRELDSARIGQLVLVSGRLAIFDLGLMREAWNISVIKDAMIQHAIVQEQNFDDHTGSHKDRQRRERMVRDAATKEMAGGLEFIRLLPHSILGSIRSNENEIWCSLREDYLTVPPSEILTKHGLVVAGIWSMVGILDAFPDDILPSPDEAPDEFAKHAMAAISLGALWQAIAAITPIARAAVGRPATSFGMTPLLVFREVTA